jgi:general secretion pathway protein G
MKDNNRSMKKLTGFTLIEMLVVIGILGIIATVLFATINPVAQLQKANDAHRKSDLESLQRALELYYQDNGCYPHAVSNEITINDGANCTNGTAVAWGTSWQVNGQTYMSKLPKDPISSNNYVYYSTGQSYYLYANLQRGANDPNACNKGNACASLSGGGFPAATACGGTCNYGVTSTNVSP